VVDLKIKALPNDPKGIGDSYDPPPLLSVLVSRGVAVPPPFNAVTPVTVRLPGTVTFPLASIVTPFRLH
jgi:hypothetical protein